MIISLWATVHGLSAIAGMKSVYYERKVIEEDYYIFKEFNQRLLIVMEDVENKTRDFVLASAEERYRMFLAWKSSRFRLFVYAVTLLFYGKFL